MYSKTDINTNVFVKEKRDFSDSRGLAVHVENSRLLTDDMPNQHKKNVFTFMRLLHDFDYRNEQMSKIVSKLKERNININSYLYNPKYASGAYFYQENDLTFRGKFALEFRDGNILLSLYA